MFGWVVGFFFCFFLPLGKLLSVNIIVKIYIFFFSSRNFMNKNQKPVLTGQRFKTRKRGMLCCILLLSYMWK